MMLRKKGAVLGLVLVALLSIVPVASADVPGPGWWTAQQIQAIEANSGGTGTTISLMAYGMSSGEYDCGSKVLNQYEAFVFVPTNSWGLTPNCSALPSGFQGSAVVTSDKQVVAVVEETNQSAAPLGASGGTADASYAGTSAPATTLSFPAYKANHAGETSTFYVQNAGTAGTRLRATFKECAAPTPGCSGTGATYTHDYPEVAANRMAIIVPADAGATEGTGRFGSLTVEALDAQPLAGVVNEHATTTGGNAARYLKSTRAFVPSEANQTLYAPVIKHTYPRNSGALSKWSALQIQNVGSGAANFTITYKIATSQANPARNGTTIVDTTTCTNIAQGQTCFVMPLFPVAGSGTSQLQEGEYASAKVTSTVAMVAVVNEETLFSYTPAADKQFATYSAIPDSSTALRVSAPGYKEEWVGRYMGVTVQNVSDVQTDVTATINNANVESGATAPSAPLVVKKTGLAPNAAVTFFLLSRNQSQSFEGVTVVSGTASQFVRTNNSMSIEAGQKIAVLVNQENSYMNPPSVRLDAANYEGFPLP